MYFVQERKPLDIALEAGLARRLLKAFLRVRLLENRRRRTVNRGVVIRSWHRYEGDFHVAIRESNHVAFEHLGLFIHRVPVQKRRVP